MKKRMLILMMMIFSVGAFAQHGDWDHQGPHHGDDKAMLDKMKEHLSLTDQQVVKIQAIHDKYDGQQKAHRAKMQQLKKEHRAMREQMRSEVEEILTPEQKAKIQEMRAKRKKGKGHRGNKMYKAKMKSSK